MRHGPIRRGAISINGNLIILSDRGRRSARKATPDADGQDGGSGGGLSTKAYAAPGGTAALPDPRERILAAARQVERSPDWDERHRDDKLATETKGHEYITD